MLWHRGVRFQFCRVEAWNMHSQLQFQRQRDTDEEKMQTESREAKAHRGRASIFAILMRSRSTAPCRLCLAESVQGPEVHARAHARAHTHLSSEARMSKLPMQLRKAHQTLDEVGGPGIQEGISFARGNEYRIKHIVQCIMTCATSGGIFHYFHFIRSN